MPKLSIEQYLIFGFLAAVTLLAVSQIIRAILAGKVISPSTRMLTKSRQTEPAGFWFSLIYYVVWVAGAIWVAVAYFLGGNLPF